MRQIDKLHSFIKNPLNYGIRKNSRVYKCLCDIACNGIATTGYSDKDTKHIETGNVMRILKRLGVASIAARVVLAFFVILGPACEVAMNIGQNALAVLARLFPGFFPGRRPAFELCSFLARTLCGFK